ncbi:MAG: hypothetical protein AB1714_00400 [Acidobacteriota bacterium]
MLFGRTRRPRGTAAENGERSVSCRDFERMLLAYHDGYVTETQWRQCGGHLRACTRCSEKLAELAATDAALRRWGQPREPEWTGSFERSVMARIRARRETPGTPHVYWWATAAAASLVAGAVGLAVWHSKTAGPTMAPVAAPLVKSHPEQPFIELSSADEADARTLYYRGIELYRNGDLARARELFVEVQSRFAGSSLAAAAAYYERVLNDAGASFDMLDEESLRAGLDAWEAIRIEALGAEESLYTLSMRAKLSYRLYQKTRRPEDRERARIHVASYLRLMPPAPEEARRWLEDLHP